ncbi:MAG: helix-turn-helix domain-containing protein [Peptostreptococcaceae bacterium]
MLRTNVGCLNVRDISDLEEIGYFLDAGDKNVNENKILEYLEIQGKTQDAFAKEIGSTKQAINPIVHGKTVPNVKMAIKMAKVLGVEIEDLFPLTETDNKTYLKDEVGNCYYLDTLTSEIICALSDEFDITKVRSHRILIETDELIEKDRYKELESEYIKSNTGSKHSLKKEFKNKSRKRYFKILVNNNIK